jgi:uncharacterized protein YyaL (SSP411 family)
MDKHLEASLKLHHFILEKHWNGQAIVGPDPIGKINWRITRFVKSYTQWLPWKDHFAYLQGQAYWIRANLILFQITSNRVYLDLVRRSADFIVQKRLDNGAWEHPPIRERKGFISTVESVWACLGLVSAYQSTGNSTYLETAIDGYQAILNVIGLRTFKDSLLINYHAHTTAMVPNVTTMLLWLAAELFEATGTDRYRNHDQELLRFIEYAQMENGELQYIYNRRPHFQCYQYNSFQFLDLAHYYRITENGLVLRILKKMAAYLASGLTERSSSRYDCFREVPEVNYWTGALAAALHQAHRLGLGDYEQLSQQAYHYLLTRQRTDGGFNYSRWNYRFLQDVRSYPRYQAMILEHLLLRAQLEPHPDHSGVRLPVSPLSTTL